MENIYTLLTIPEWNQRVTGGFSSQSDTGEALVDQPGEQKIDLLVIWDALLMRNRSYVLVIIILNVKPFNNICKWYGV